VPVSVASSKESYYICPSNFVCKSSLFVLFSAFSRQKYGGGGGNFSLMIIYLRVYDLGKYIRHILIYGLYCIVCVCMCCVRMYKCVRAMVSLMMVLPRYKWIYNARYVRKKGCMDKAGQQIS
jgi:hypothetical protein